MPAVIANLKDANQTKRQPLSLRSVLVLCIVGFQFVTLLAVLVLLYFGMNHAILQQSKGLLERRSDASVERIISFFQPSVQVNEMLVKLVESGANDAQQNQMMERLIYGALRTSPEISGVYFGRPDGSFVQVYRLEGSDDTVSKVIEGPGTGATFLRRNQGYLPTDRYTDPTNAYDPRTTPWYVKARDSGTRVWTDTYALPISGKMGVTIASPVYLNGRFLGVFGTDIEIGKLGQVLVAGAEDPFLSSTILTTSGDIVLRVDGDQITDSTTLDGLTKMLFDKYSETKDDFVAAYEGIGDGGDTDYVIANIHPLFGLDMPWLLATRAPQTALTGGLLDNQSSLILVTLLLIVFMSLFAIPLADRIRKPVLNFWEQKTDPVASPLTLGPWLKAPYSELEHAGQVIATEISKRRNSELRYDRTFNASARGMAQIDPETLRFLHVNSRLCALLEMTEDKVLGLGLDAVLAKRDRQKMLGSFRDAVTSDKDYTVEADFKTGRNGFVPLRMTAFLMRDFNGNPEHAFAIFDDNEESKTSATRLQNFKRDMERIGRINLMGHFAASLAHELNQPLGALVHDVDSAKFVLKETDIDRVELEEILGDIDGHAQRAGEIILALRNIIDKDSQAKSSFELSDLLEQTQALLSPEAATCDVNLEAKFCGRCVIMGNRVQIAQALVNLIRNAMSALNSSDVHNKAVMLEATESDGQIVISVEDNGPGFPSHLTPFTQFETTKPDGLGLGLSISKSLVEANKGTITHMEGAGVGTRFEISLPGERVAEGSDQNG